jgi:peptidoglycan/LPS O-acetylase OafA/YrhL
LPVDILISHVSNMGDVYWQIIYDNLHTRYGAIVLGIILAHLYIYHWNSVSLFMTERRCMLMLFAALGLFVLSMILPVFSGEPTSKSLLYFYHVTHRNVFSLGVMFIMMLCLLDKGAGIPVNRFLSSRVFYPISQLTYSMYLLQLPVIGFCYLALKDFGIINGISYQNAVIVFAVSLLPTMAVSSLMYVFVERPFMKMRSQ